MDPQLKQRLIGAIALLLAGVLIIPLILDGPPPGSPYAAPAPAEKPPTKPPVAKPPSDFRPPPPPKSASPQAQASTAKPVAERWWVQVGSFRQRAGARELADALKKAGYPVYLDRIKPWHRVRVGPLRTQTQAYAAGKKIAQSFEVEPLVIRSSP